MVATAFFVCKPTVRSGHGGLTFALCGCERSRALLVAASFCLFLSLSSDRDTALLQMF